MLFETVWFVNKAVYVSILVVLLAIIPRLPYYVLLGAGCVVMLAISTKFSDPETHSLCKTEFTETACVNRGMCSEAKMAFDSDFEWSRYRRNVCMGVTANDERLLTTYNPSNCNLWGGCDDDECKATLKELNERIKEFKCPSTIGDRDKAMRLYQNTNEDTAFMFPGDDMGLAALPLIAGGAIVLAFLGNVNEDGL